MRHPVLALALCLPLLGGCPLFAAALLDDSDGNDPPPAAQPPAAPDGAWDPGYTNPQPLAPPPPLQAPQQFAEVPPPQSASGGREAEALAFFDRSVRACPAAASRADGARISESRPGDIFVVLDGAGRRMLVHLSARLIYGPGGPQGVMPRPYLNCQHNIFVGTMDH